MKKWVPLLLILVLFTGCTADHGELDRAMTLRAKLLGTSECTYDAVVTADYGDEIHTFRMECVASGNGDVKFQVTQPESIAGITGTLTGTGGKLTFDDKALAFDMLADEQLSPISAPWMFLKTLRGGYVTSCGSDGDGIRVSIDDSYEEDALHVDIWLDAQDAPTRAEFIYDDRRIITLDIENFRIL